MILVKLAVLLALLIVTAIWVRLASALWPSSDLNVECICILKVSWNNDMKLVFFVIYKRAVKMDCREIHNAAIETRGSAEAWHEVQEHR